MLAQQHAWRIEPKNKIYLKTWTRRRIKGRSRIWRRRRSLSALIRWLLRTKVEGNCSLYWVNFFVFRLFYASIYVGYWHVIGIVSPKIKHYFIHIHLKTHPKRMWIRPLEVCTMNEEKPNKMLKKIFFEENFNILY